MTKNGKKTLKKQAHYFELSRLS